MAATKRFGLLLDHSTSYGRRVFAGIRRFCLRRTDIRMVLAEPRSGSVKRWRASTVDGVIAHVAGQGLASTLHRSGLPVVNVSGALAEDFVRVGVDDQIIGRMAADFFIERQFTSFAYYGNTGRCYSEARWAGFSSRLAENGWPCACFTGPEQLGPEEAIPWVRGQRHPLALLTVGDGHALGLIRACRAADLGVPDPVAVLAGFNDEEVCTLDHPTISAVDTPGEQIGYRAAQLLDRWLDGGSRPDALTVIPPSRIVERESTQAEALRDREVAAALRFIREHATQAIGVDDVARAADCHRRHLERRFTSLLGSTVYHHVLLRRVNLAKKLLEETRFPLATIARDTGFAGAQHFCTAFRRIDGRTPGQYREQAVGLRCMPPTDPPAVDPGRG